MINAWKYEKEQLIACVMPEKDRLKRDQVRFISNQTSKTVSGWQIFTEYSMKLINQLTVISVFSSYSHNHGLVPTFFPEHLHK